jgi:hypothetical protein
MKAFIILPFIGMAMLSQAQGVLDQSFTAPTSPTSSAFLFGVPTNNTPGVQVEQAQIFTVGVSGMLSVINLQIRQYLDYGQSSLTNPVTVSVRTLSGAFPASTLASVSVPASSIPTNPSPATWVSADFSSALLLLSAGEQLAIVVTSAQTETFTANYGWYYSGSGSGYANGDSVGRSIGYPWGTHNSDFGFQTYVVPAPEPGAIQLGLLASSTVLVAAWRRRRMQR